MSGFGYLPGLIGRARGSRFWLFVLNVLLRRVIPFNAPHRFRLLEIGEEQVRTSAPYLRSNYNHIKGIHACAIATAAEFSAGFLLLTRLDPAKYRLIMAKLQAEYFYQAKMDIVAETRLSSERLERDVIAPLKTESSTTIEMSTAVRDSDGNNVAVVATIWQVKRWEKVRTKV